MGNYCVSSFPFPLSFFFPFSSLSPSCFSRSISHLYLLSPVSPRFPVSPGTSILTDASGGCPFLEFIINVVPFRCSLSVEPELIAWLGLASGKQSKLHLG